MGWIPDRYRALRALVWGEHPDRDVAEEFEHHLAMRVEENIAKGMTADEARAEALRRFGDLEAYRRETRQIDERVIEERRRTEVLDTVRREMRHAVRSLARSPGFTLIAIITLALGIGANTAIFSVVNSVMLHPLPVRGLDELVVIQDDLPGLDLRNTEISPAEALDLFQRRDLFQAATAFTSSNRNLTGSSEPQRIAITSTLGQFFDVFGTRPHLGRLYRPEDSENGNHQVAVLSYAFWQDLTGGDPRVIGSTLQLNDRPYEVIGVLPPEFRYPRRVQIWTPMPVAPGMLAPNRRGDLYMTAVARLNADITVVQLRSQLAAEAERWHERLAGQGYPPGSQHTVVAVPFLEYLGGQLRPILLVLSGAVALVLLIACANVASLQLVRGSARTRESAIRAALGAGRWPIVRQHLLESLLVAIGGGLAGIAVGKLVLRLVAHSDAAQFAMLRDVRLDTPVLLFTGVVTLATALVFGAAPALRAARVDAGDVLKESAARGSSAGRARNRMLNSAIVVQVSLALVLLLGSGLAIRSLARLLAIDPGFRPEHVLTMQLSVGGSRYPTPASRLAFHDALLERLRSTPGIEAVGTAFGLPFTDLGTSSPFRVAGRTPGPNDPKWHANMWHVGGDYFRALGVQLLAGRAFTDADAEGTQPVSIIDETLAKQFFPNEDPIGKQIVQGMESTIIGVVRSVKKEDLAAPDKAAIYYPYRQFAWAIGSTSIAVRTSLPMNAAAGVLRSAVREIDPNLPAFDIVPLQDRVGRSLGARRLAMAVLTGFAALSLVLAVLGIYGVLSYGVAQRTQELGIRMALGAQPGDVVRLVVRNGLALVGIGLAVGTVAFVGLGRVTAAFLYGVGPRDPVTLLSGIALLVAAAFIACWIPARRATRVDPVRALRAE